ncbi:MAG TPA: transglutaminase domain-containing protein [Bacteroidales bacterium]|nr:transglutaminase domain-containing protein [Bacteroidales bacterium]
MAEKRGDELFSFRKQNLPPEQEEAMEFMIAYMPLSDLADYDGDFFLDNVKFALRSREEKSWGTRVPEEIFLHYVLPVRVNNENLDSFRIRYYDEIGKRIYGLDPKAAALEVNHWCHEKVSYQPSDDRTSAPESTILSARGRCGEESTFVVAALRAAGLPARQVYTPRWAHSDDNHAWVEVWLDGTWYYMGACEPEPVLDRGWFTEPARRAMLIHTKSFGAPFGESNQIVAHRNFSLINNLSKYAVTKKIFVKTLDSYGKPASDAEVEFQLYNYSEFYPLATIKTGKDGLCSFETGLGDLVIWAHNADDFDFRKITVSDTDTLTLTLSRKPPSEGYAEYDLGVPLARAPLAGPEMGLVKDNNVRLEKENSVRQGYISTWMKPGAAVKLAVSVGADTSAVKDIISRSMGNWKEISAFLRDVQPLAVPAAIRLLSLVSDKDIRDTREAVLMDHLMNTSLYVKDRFGCDKEVYYSYVLNPRIANEKLVPWRKFLLSYLPSSVWENGQNDPDRLVKYVNASITVNDSDNYYHTPLTPTGVAKLRISDSFSRNIFFIALCRSYGIPARLEAGSNLTQYFYNGKWHDVYFNGTGSQTGMRGYLSLHSSDVKPVPEYYIHFTIARFENGRYNTLEYDYNRRITDFRDEIALIPGHYMLVTGNRIDDSKILSSVTFFDIKANEHKNLEVKLRRQKGSIEILGKIDMNSKLALPDGKTKPLRDFSSKGLVIAWIEPDKEPTKHIMNDLPLLRKELDSWGGSFIFLSDGNRPGHYENLPANTVFAADKDSEILKQMCSGSSCSEIRYPLILLVRNDGSVIFRSEGYRIGIGEQILKNIN